MMASAFTITTQTNAIMLDAERRGLVVFTVANQTGRSVRARMSASPFPPASEEWFWIEPEGNSSDRMRAVERLLPPGSSETCNVRIEVNADASPGAQAIRLDVVSVERPDEEWAHGPAVGFEIPVPIPEPPPPPKGYIETIGGALAGASAGIIIGSLSGLLIALVAGLPVQFSLMFGFVTLFGGGLVAAAALGGAIGAFAALRLRAILSPEPWRTALAYLVAALALGTLMQLVAVLATPRPAGAVFGPVDDILVMQSPIIRTFFPVTAVPVTATPTAAASPQPTPSPSPVVAVRAPEIAPLLTVLLALVGTALAAGAARAFTRWRDLGSL